MEIKDILGVICFCYELIASHLGKISKPFADNNFCCLSEITMEVEEVLTIRLCCVAIPIPSEQEAKCLFDSFSCSAVALTNFQITFKPLKCL